MHSHLPVPGCVCAVEEELLGHRQGCHSCLHEIQPEPWIGSSAHMLTHAVPTCVWNFQARLQICLQDKIIVEENEA